MRDVRFVKQVQDVGRKVADVTNISANANHTDVTRFCGFSVRESAAIAGAATVIFRRGSASGQILAVVELAANGSATHTFPFEMDTTGGVYVDVTVGTVSGVLIHRGR